MLDPTKLGIIASSSPAAHLQQLGQDVEHAVKKGQEAQQLGNGRRDGWTVAVPSIVTWLLGFVAFFHSILNILAEF